MQSKMKRVIIRIIFIAVWLIIWQTASAVTGLELILASPVNVFKAIAGLVVTKTFYITVLNSFIKITSGFFVAFVLAVILGMVSARFYIIKEFLTPPVQLMKTLPMTSFIILLLIWFGSANVAAFIAFIVVFPVVYVSVISGIEHIDKEVLEMVNVFDVPALKKCRCVYLPSVWPYVKSGLKTVMGMCWKAGVSAEVIGLVRYSIGEQLYYSKLYFMTADLFAWSIMVVVVSMIFEIVFVKLLCWLVAILRKP